MSAMIRETVCDFYLNHKLVAVYCHFFWLLGRFIFSVVCFNFQSFRSSYNIVHSFTKIKVGALTFVITPTIIKNNHSTANRLACSRMIEQKMLGQLWRNRQSYLYEAWTSRATLNIHLKQPTLPFAVKLG